MAISALEADVLFSVCVEYPMATAQAIRNRLSAVGNGDASIDVTYATLGRLEDAGLITSEQRAVAGALVWFFTPTDAGRREHSHQLDLDAHCLDRIQLRS